MVKFIEIKFYSTTKTKKENGKSLGICTFFFKWEKIKKEKNEKKEKQKGQRRKRIIIPKKRITKNYPENLLFLISILIDYETFGYFHIKIE